MANAYGFWSYVHSDDDADGGRIAQLARDVATQYEMISADPIELFLDRDNLEWGDDWHPKVDASLAQVAFFIPVLTPRYFRSAECRRELQFFARKAQKLGISELIMPLLYVDYPPLRDESESDDLVILVRQFQWEDWTDLRFAERESEKYRTAVAKLADRLVRANADVQRVDIASAAEELEQIGDPVDDELGFIDRVALAEDAMPNWAETLNRITSELMAITGVMENASADMQSAERQGKGFAGRLMVARKVASDLAEPASNIKSLGNDFASQLHAVDTGIRAIIEQAAVAVANDPADIADVCTFFNSVREMWTAADEGLGAIATMIEAMAPTENLSRDLRPPLAELRQGLTLMLEGREVIREWVELIDKSPVRCEQV